MKDLTSLLFAEATQKGIPLGGTFELTPLCNMNCKMCYIRMTKEERDRKGRERTAEEWLDLARQAKEQGMLFLLLTGGEPFLYKDFWYLYEELKKMGLLVSINSNATMLQGEILEKLIKNPPVRINITIYGGSDKTYADLCRCPDGYTRATEAVRKLREAGVAVKINGSITPQNCDDIIECFDFAKEMDTLCQLGSYMFPPTRRDDVSTARFTAEEAGIYQAKIDKMRYEPQDLAAIIAENERCDREGSRKDYPQKFRCRAGKSGFWITWKGEMTGCGMMEKFYEHPFEDGFAECWKRLHKTISEQTVLTACKDCEQRDICKVCPAMALAETGDFNKKPQYICQMNEAWKKELCK